MDQIWLASPSPAMRLWPGKPAAVWRLNEAALAWAHAHDRPVAWQAVADELTAALMRSAECEGRLVGVGGCWRSLPMATGWLVWLMPDSAIVPDRKADGRAGTPLEPAKRGSECSLPQTQASRQANAARSELLARISHELRTPLNAVLGFAQLIEHEGDGVPFSLQLERVGQIRKASEKIVELVDDVLDPGNLQRLTDQGSPNDGEAIGEVSGRPDASRSGRSGGPLTVLYIEDNPVNVILVEELVAMRANTFLQCAPDGLSGVDRAAASLPDVVLVDIQLPDIDGFEVLRRLRSTPGLEGSAIIALSANGISEDIALARAAGFDDYWTKPIDFRHFLQGLDDLAALR